MYFDRILIKHQYLLTPINLEVLTLSRRWGTSQRFNMGSRLALMSKLQHCCEKIGHSRVATFYCYRVNDRIESYVSFFDSTWWRIFLLKNSCWLHWYHTDMRWYEKKITWLQNSVIHPHWNISPNIKKTHQFIDNICNLILGFGSIKKTSPRSTFPPALAGTVQTTCNNPSKPRPLELALIYSNHPFCVQNCSKYEICIILYHIKGWSRMMV